MKPPDPETKPNAVLGFIQENAVWAAEKGMKDICDHYGYDRAYWDLEITTRLRQLGADFKPLKDYTIIKHFEIGGETE